MPRCPNGTRKNKKTGVCDRKEKKVVAKKSTKKRYCKYGERDHNDMCPKKPKSEWSLSSVTYYKIHLSSEDSEEIMKEYKKGYFQFEEIHLRGFDATTHSIITLMISFSENLISVKMNEEEWKEFPLAKKQINQYLASLNIPVIKKINDRGFSVNDLEDDNYSAAVNIQSMKNAENVHTGLKINEPGDSESNKQFVAKHALSDLKKYL